MERRVSAVLLCLFLLYAGPRAWGQTLYDFNLPRQDLAETLRAIGRQTTTNILFEPGAVEHVIAPAVHAQLSTLDAVNRVLVGTGLAVQQATSNTLLVRLETQIKTALQDHEENSAPETARESIQPVRLELQTQTVPETTQASTDQGAQGADEPGKPAMEQVTVTGSLFPQQKVAGVAPEITISARDIEDQGFRNVYDAIRNLPIASGSVQDAQSTGGFTPGASEISLFGLDPSFTLTLLNGRPLADYPLAFNGASDITDLANIPVGLIDHIDVLTGAASSIYGSSAVAGVVNIVLKDKTDGFSINVRDGGYEQGGGQNQRAQFSGGFNSDRLDVVFGMELMHQTEMLQLEAPGMATYNAATPNPRDFLILGPKGYVDPGAATCAPLSNLFGGTLAYSYRPNEGYYCGSNAAGYNSVINADNQYSGLLTAKYRLTDHITPYTQLLYGHSEPTYSGGLPGWSTNDVKGNVGGYIWDATLNQPVLVQRIFSPAEIGGWNGENQHLYTHEFNGTVGVKGEMGDSNINYDVYYHLSQENTHYVSYSGNFIDQRAAAYYLGPQLGTTAGGYPIYAPDLSRLYAPVTQAQYDSWIGARSEYSVSWTDDFTAIFNSSKLFALPAGDVGSALILQYGTDEVHTPPDPNVLAGLFDNLSERPNSAGSRNHYSFGTEFRIPVVSMLTADVSGRYDHYSYTAGTGFGGTETSGKFTYKGGLEFRPLNELLVRASYATAFRTPDLFYLFEGPTTSYSTVTDWYQCRKAGYTNENISSCPYSSYAGTVSPKVTSSGSTQLQDITAKSFTAGFVWTPLENRLRLSVDYSRVNIANEVQQTNLDTLLQTEADCRLGVSEGGQAYNINSPTCQNTFALVQRGATGSIASMISTPTNIALEHEAAVQGQISYSWPTQRAGSFSAGLRYFRQLQHTTTAYAGDVPLNQLCCDNSDEFFSTTTADVTWKFGPSTTTLHGIRNAPTWNAVGLARDLGPYIVVNGSERIDVPHGMYIEVIVNNIFNRYPPLDPTNNSYPYYDTGEYNDYGRAFWLEFGVKFGGGARR